MFSNHKKLEQFEREISELEGKISELERQIPSEGRIGGIAREVIRDEEKELSRLYEARDKVREKAWDSVKEDIDAYAAEYMGELVKKSVKDIEDKLIVELARKAMNMEEK